MKRDDGLLTKNFDKLLIANRGEIAMRILRACHELGIKTVAVFSEADRKSPHVRFADEAYCIGAPAARDSYLRMDKLIAIAQQSGAQAIHPGYGFLAERAEFAQMCVDHDIVFVGPPARAIEMMGDKQVARETVKAAGVPIVPGTEPGLSDEEMVEAGIKMGFPILVKAVAGGGGKGMRPVHKAAELPGAIAGARREAEAAFGDGAVYLEKMITGARHIEIQLLADVQGNAIHLGERECSLQRRHQKLIEEAPSFVIDEALRQRMGSVAVAAAKAVDYVNAGTIEFLFDRDNNFYFLEMNTRVQVEHPVTELVTGIDIVQEQLRVARGRKLRFAQDDVQVRGWAIECRINAEDPYNHYLPSTGIITTMRLPSGSGVRLDTGVCRGYAITPYYDSMISKLICYGETRAEAVLRMRRALEEYHIMGVKTNIPFHQHMMDSPRFLTGQFDTNFVEERFSMNDREVNKDMEAAVMAALVAHHQSMQASTQMTPVDNDRSGSNWKWAKRR
ncbi:MAG: acetyl-CoA carboxylase biotin carboxylase subunit [Chloroflexi bacterium]|nr:MAG: acetyl-CoA carboxylase biotin carboxylase subunit [Chloroflexota bacterium]